MKELMDKLNKFAATTQGKVITILVFVVVIGAVFFSIKGILFPPAPTSQMNNDSGQTPAAENVQATPEIATQTSENELTSELASVSSYSIVESGFEVFSSEILRDPFAPFPQPVTETTVSTQTTATVEQEGSISLIGIDYDEGRFVASLAYKNELHSLKEGDTVGPYMVISIGENQVRLLYGDIPVYLSVGQTYRP